MQARSNSHYAGNSLVPGERIVYTGRTSPAASLVSIFVHFFRWAFFGLVLGIVSFIVLQTLPKEVVQAPLLDDVRRFTLSALQSAGELLEAMDIETESFFIHWVAAWSICFSVIRTCIFAIEWIIYCFSTELVITNKRVIAKFGFIGRTTIELDLRKIESVQIQQRIAGRILGFGDIVLSCSGIQQAPIPCILNPLRFRREFVLAQERA